MSDRKKCHRSIRYNDRFQDKVEAVECIQRECALWDEVHTCCGDMSMVMEGRQPFLFIVRDLVTNFQGSLAKVEQELETEELAPEGKGFKRGQRNLLGQVIDVLRRRFGV
jgi:hypothetical protein